MNLRVNLCNFPANWRFHGSLDFDRWLATQPWAESGGSVSVRLADSMQASQFIPRLQHCFESSRQGGLPIQFRTLDPEQWGEGGDLESAICTELNLRVPENARRFTRCERIADYCRNVGPLVVFVEASSSNPNALPYAAQRLSESVMKMVAGARLTAVVFECEPHPIDPGAFDFTAGMPEGCVVPLLQGEDRLLWSAYLHTRVAWECGGHLRAAQQIEAELGDPSTGYDAELEARLNRIAVQLWDTVSKERAKWLRARIRRMIADHDHQETDSSLPSESGWPLLWRPPGEHELWPIPWVARALLQEQAVPSDWRPLLRYALVVRPLARDLLALCLQLEAARRARLESQYVDKLTATGEAQDHLARFRAGVPGTARHFYPNHHPGLPDEPLQFESIGSFIHLLREKGHSISASLERLREVRNALAHGHHVGWRMLQDARAILD